MKQEMHSTMVLHHPFTFEFAVGDQQWIEIGRAHVW
jgi:hypothetical protein